MKKVETELEYWARRRMDARVKIREIDHTRDKLKELTLAYDRIFARACNAFDEADRMCAELEGKVRRIPAGVSGRRRKGGGALLDPRLMDKEFLAELIKLLGKEK